MSRRSLTFAVVALASLVVSACGTSPTAPQAGVRAPSSVNADLVTPVDSTNARSGWAGSSG